MVDHRHVQFYTGEPASYNIDALEDSEILQISQQNYEEMMQRVPRMERYFRLLLQNRLIAMQRRLAVTSVLPPNRNISG